MAATIGSQFISVAVGWDLYERTNDAWMLGLVGLVQIVPALALTLPAGNVADRFPRRHVGMAAHALLAIAALGLTMVNAYDMPVEFVFLLLVLTGVGRAFAMPSTSTLLAQIMPPREFANAYAWLVSSGHLASIGGPAAGGVLIAATGGATAAYAIAAVGHLVFIASLLALPVIAADARHRRGFSDLFAGIGFMRNTPVFLAAITLDLFGVLLGGAVALMPVFARDILLVGPSGLGLLRAAPSLGALSASLLATRMPPWRQPGRVLLIAVAGFGLATIGFGLSRDVGVSLVCLFMTGACDSISMVIRGTLQQIVTPDELRGRVAAVNSLFIGLSNELGAFESGATAALFGPVISVVGGGIGTLVVVAAVAGIWPSLRELGPLHTLHATPATAPASRPAFDQPTRGSPSASD